MPTTTLPQLTQKQAILEHLQSGKTLTAMSALKLYRCMRLAARIKDLRDEGHTITSTSKPVHNGPTITEYKLVVV